ncbi:MAG: glycosyltransferase family 39 protein [Anaerolineae bacterium]|nr:glycosyltransferase family 39 protein [Anaerolineae bacterium]
MRGAWNKLDANAAAKPIGKWLWFGIILLLLLWWTRIHALIALPLHNDEGLHLTRAVEVWNGHPFWEISDGKIINHWLIAVFYPQNAPDFVGRIATVFLALIGLAAGYDLLRREFGAWAAIFGGCFWLLAPPVFFYERLALSDTESAALGVLAVWAALRMARSGKAWMALATGAALSAALLFKYTAAPFIASVLLIAFLVGTLPWRTRLRNAAIIAAVGVLAFTVPVVYTVVRGKSFGIALGWVGVTTSGSLSQNIERFLLQVTDTGGWSWSFLWLVGLALLVGVMLARRRWRWGVVLAASAIPLLTVLLFGKEIMPRHSLTGLPILLLMAGAGFGLVIEMMPPSLNNLRWLGVVLVIGWLAFDAYIYMDTAYQEPADVGLPPLDQDQFITGHSAGFGLREAMRDLPNHVQSSGDLILSSMFPDSCRRANFYAVNQHILICTAAPGVDKLEEALKVSPRVLVLVEKPPVGADMRSIPDIVATQVADYPRPGETDKSASVTLWEVRKKQ